MGPGSVKRASLKLFTNIVVGIIAMSDVIREREQSKEITLVETISDEALEAAAGAGSDRAGHYTLFYCTALDLCPGP